MMTVLTSFFKYTTDIGKTNFVLQPEDIVSHPWLSGSAITVATWLLRSLQVG